MKNAHTARNGFQRILEQTAAELVHGLRSRDEISIERSADQLDEIQLASERDLAIQTLDRESVLLREVKAALRRIHDGNYGTCTDCERTISPKRLAVVPWAPRCIHCQEAADRNGHESPDFLSQTQANAT